MPRRSRSRELAVAVVLVFVVALAGCGDDEPEGTAPRTWARQVCTGLSGWLEGVQEATTRLTEGAATETEQAKASVSAFLEEVTSRTDRLLGVVADAGTPAVEDGEALARDFRQAIQEVRNDFAESRQRTEALPTGDRAAFQSGLAQVARDLQDASQRLQERLDKVEEDYEAPELEKALEEEPACGGVGGRSTAR